MKKGCLIAGVVIVLLLFAVGAFWLIRLDRELGLREAGAISHEQFATPRTKFRAVIDGPKIEELIIRHLPKNIPLPAWVPVSIPTLVKKGLPHEVAILEESDYATSEVTFTLFLNERRFGPFLADKVRMDDVSPEMNILRWDTPLFKMPERGALQATAHLPIPDGLESRLLEDWTHDIAGEPLKVEGGHLAEVVLDNRNGEIFTLLGAMIKANGGDWRAQLLEQGAVLVMSILPMIHDVRLNADLTAPDTLRIRLRTDADPNAATALNLFAGFSLPALKEAAAFKGMKLDGSATWSDAEQALLGDFTLTGFEPLIEQQVTAMFPGAAPSK